MAAARAAVVVLLAVVAALSVWLGPLFALVAAGYLALNVVYSLWLRDQVLLDVFFIAFGFVLRAIAGVELLKPGRPGDRAVAVAAGLHLLRRAVPRLGQAAPRTGQRGGRRRGSGGRCWRGIHARAARWAAAVSAAASIMGYALYTIWPETVEKFGTRALLYTVPFVTYGIFRYLYVVRVSETAEDPSRVLLTDRPLLGCVLAYLVVVLLILYTHG